MASEKMPNPGLPMIFFGKPHIDLPKKPDLIRKSQVDTKLIESFYYCIYHTWTSVITKSASEYVL